MVGLGRDSGEQARDDIGEEGCGQDEAKSCAELAVAHEKGRMGLNPSGSQAVAFYRKACDLGDGGSCTNAAMRRG